MKHFPAAVLFILPVLTAFGSDELVCDFWTELEPSLHALNIPAAPEISSGETFMGEIKTEAAVERILEEAAYVFSGMIYGFSFVYTPSDVRRKIPETFDLLPIASVRRGDPGLIVRSSRIENGKLHVRTAYRMKDFQITRREGYASNILPKIGGRAEVNVFSGKDAKIESVKAAVKNAVREHARSIEYNKPREIRGEAYLLENPYIMVLNGTYLTQVTVKLALKEIRPYPAF